jgi:hypothetical protein
MSVTKTGDWDGFASMLANASARFKKKVQDATNKAGRLIEAKAVDRIQSNQVTPPTGAVSKAWKEKHGYSDTTLIMSSDMMNAIKYEKKAWNEGFAGINRNAVGKDGNSLVSIAAMHEEFGVISKGGRIKRPFIAPVVEQVKPEIGAFYQKAVEDTFKK